jgi:hypothetical protein
VVNDYYLDGALALIRSKKINSPCKVPFICLYNNISDYTFIQLKNSGYTMNKIDCFADTYPIAKELNVTDKYKYTFDKLWLWTLKFKNIVYLDADMIIKKNINILFLKTKDKHVCAVKDSPLFNTGIMVITPSIEIFEDMVNYIKLPQKIIGYNWGYQEFLSSYWKNRFISLDLKYNCLKANDNFEKKCRDCNVLHWNGLEKPWDTNKDWWINCLSNGLKDNESNRFKSILKRKKYRHVHRSIIQLFYDTVNKYNLFFWVQSGTALGFIREKDIIDGDTDVDIAIWATDFGFFIDKCLPSLESKGFYIGRSNPLSIVFDNHYIDIDIVGKDLPCMDGFDWWPSKCDKYMHTIHPFSQVEIWGRTFNVPSMNYIYAAFGEDWRIPKQCKVCPSTFNSNYIILRRCLYKLVDNKHLPAEYLKLNLGSDGSGTEIHEKHWKNGAYMRHEPNGNPPPSTIKVFVDGNKTTKTTLYHFYIPFAAMSFLLRKHSIYDLLTSSTDKNYAKNKFCIFMFKNKQKEYPLAVERYALYEQLTKIKHVDNPAKTSIYAKGGNIFDEAVEIYKPYRFAISYENTLVDGYITEKIINAFLAGCIPIYKGSARVYEYFNENSFIDANKFKTTYDLIKYIIKVENTPQLLYKYLNTPPCTQDKLNSLFNYLL